MTPMALPVVAYLLGALPVSLWVARGWSGRDLRRVGSGNTGATNVLRTAGWFPAVLAFLGDAAKGALPVLLGEYLAVSERILAATALAAVLGHVFSPLLRFRGGKGVATALGGFSVLAPLVALCVVGLFIVLVWTTRYVSVGSICAVLSFPLIWLGLSFWGWEQPPTIALLAATSAVGALVLWRHADNLRRLWQGSETRVGARLAGGQREMR